MTLFRRCLIAFTLAMPIIHMVYAAECSCVCGGRRSQSNICDAIKELRLIGDSNYNKLVEWEKHIPFVARFSERWKKEIADIVETKMKEYIDGGKFHPKSENIVIRDEDGIQSDSAMISKPPEDGSDLVSNLLAKVEMVENRTTEVEEELKSERSVREHLEQEVKETQSSLNSLGDRLLNVTVPDGMMDQVQFVMSSLEDMNKTIYEDHLKKLYYKVDGVVYKNETKKLGERLEHVETELHDGDNSSIVFKLAEDFKTLEENFYLLNNSIGDTVVSHIEVLNNSIESALVPRIKTLETETVRKDAVEELEVKMENLLNNTEQFRNALDDVWSDIQNIRNFEKQHQNFSEEWAKSLEALENEVEYLKNETVMSRLVQQPDDVYENNEIFQQKITGNIPQENGSTEDEDNAIWEPEVTPSVMNRSSIFGNDTKENEESITLQPEVTTNIVDRTRIGGVSDQDSESCGKLVISDPHLLADVVNDTYGRKSLKFGCRPIGLHAVSHLPVPPRCEMGSWKEPFPSCKRLPDIAKIESLTSELLKEHPCAGGSGEFPDPSNCSQFFKCAHGNAGIIPCPKGLNFNAMLKVCDYPKTASCELSQKSHEKELLTLIPPIHIEPDTLDKPSSHLGTGPSGQLIIHPRSSFTLHCLYPENVWGPPIWNVTYTHTNINSRDLTAKEGKNRISITVTAAMEEDSGTYKCLTPFGVQHAIEVVVKVVICPAFILEDEYEDVFYRPTPEGEMRIMGTTAEFICEEGHRIIAQCMADGKWSRGFPPEDECTVKKRNSDKMWNCKPFDLNKYPDLILERNDIEKIVTFKCAGRKRLVGNSFTRCRDDGVWSHVSLPRCHN